MAYPPEDLLDEEAALLALPSMNLNDAHRTFERLWLKYQDSVTRFIAFKKGWSRHPCACEVDELVQETSINAWLRVRSADKPLYLTPGATFGSYVLMIATNVLYRCVRDGNSSGLLSQESLDMLQETQPQLLSQSLNVDQPKEDESSILDALAQISMLDSINQDTISKAQTMSRQTEWLNEHPVIAALSRLSKRRRQCVVLHCFFKLPYKSIAALLGISVGTVGGYINDAREQLREHLHDLLHDDDSFESC